MNVSYPPRTGTLTLTVPSGVYFADSDPDTNWYFHDRCRANAAFRIYAVAVRAPAEIDATLAIDFLQTRIDLFPVWACRSLVTGRDVPFPSPAARTSRFMLYGYDGPPLDICALLVWRTTIPGGPHDG